MRIIDVSSSNFHYLNILLRKLKQGKISEREFIKLQETLYLWSENNNSI